MRELRRIQRQNPLVKAALERGAWLTVGTAVRADEDGTSFTHAVRLADGKIDLTREFAPRGAQAETSAPAVRRSAESWAFFQHLPLAAWLGGKQLALAELEGQLSRSAAKYLAGRLDGGDWLALAARVKRYTKLDLWSLPAGQRSLETLGRSLVAVGRDGQYRARGLADAGAFTALLKRTPEVAAEFEAARSTRSVDAHFNGGMILATPVVGLLALGLSPWFLGMPDGGMISVGTTLFASVLAAFPVGAAISAFKESHRQHQLAAHDALARAAARGVRLPEELLAMLPAE